MRCSETLDLIITLLPELLRREEVNENLVLLRDGRYKAKIKGLFANVEEESGCSQRLNPLLKIGGGDERNKEREFQLSINRNTMSSTCAKAAKTHDDSLVVVPEELRSSVSFGQINGVAAKFFLDEIIRNTFKSTKYRKQFQEQTQFNCGVVKKHL
ncbi:unnamed protein product [Rodentolepis nana]|uniref:Uncharacterized protein n=1 Tax=Rodentolepis nana TaxID=102285 RepID=A0A0R3T2V1_RODNA|nr:unnamed protein product [Rodentolepis nana]